MQIEKTGSNELTIRGNIKSIDDSTQIKEAVGALKDAGAGSILLRIEDSFSMTSTVIGFLMKLVNIDQLKVTLLLTDRRLHQLLDELNLVQPFNVRLVEKC